MPGHYGKMMNKKKMNNGKKGKTVPKKLKGFPYQANLCAAIINHANSMGKKIQDDIKQIIQKL